MKLIAFDVDGTILDTLDSIIHVVNETLYANGFYKVDDKEYIRKALGYGSYYLIEQALIFPYNHFYDKNVTKEVLEDYLKRYMDDDGSLTKPYEGVVNLIKELKDEGYKVIAYSNKPDSVLKPLMLEKFGNLFDEVLGQVEGQAPKPNPEALLNMLDKIGISKEEAIYIGDSDVDVQTAKNANMKMIAVTWGFRDREFLEKLNPEYIVDDTKELKEVIDSLK
ncbi:MAG: HAD family hydrolase [Helcococcus sp.]|nr:HAD family hydrolase [Helcococcus sp.]